LNLTTFGEALDFYLARKSVGANVHYFDRMKNINVKIVPEKLNEN